MNRRDFLKTSGAVAAGTALPSRQDRLLGMEAPIQRQDFVGGVARESYTLPPELTPEEWNGFSGVGDYRGKNGNTYEVVKAGHAIRDGHYDPSMLHASRPDETYDCVVVGGGITGLAAAHTFLAKAKPGQTCLVLENHAIFGGEARQNEFEVNGKRLLAAQGSAMFFPPLPGSSLLAFYESIGFDGQPLHYQTVSGGANAVPVAITSYAGDGPNLGMYFGKMFGHPEGLWLKDPYGKKLEGAPFPEAVKQQMLHPHPAGGPAMPRPQAYGDAASRALDQITQEEFLMRDRGYSREMIRTYMPYAGSAAGASADIISGFADFAPDLLFPWDQKQQSQMFPGGNAGIARYLLKTLVPEALPGPLTNDGICSASIDFAALDRARQPVRVRLHSTVMAVRHDGDPAHASSVTIGYMHQGKPRHVRAGCVVMAGGWTTSRTVMDLPAAHRDAYQQFHRMPCLVANIALTNWRFLADQGLSQAKWFEGLGESFAIRRMPVLGPYGPNLSPDDPTVITLKIYFVQPGLPLAQQGAQGRMRLLATPFSVYERQLREQFQMMFGGWGFAAKRDIAGIILNRWGHAYLCAQPGFFFGFEGRPAPRELLRRAPFGRIGFANSDLSGIMDHRASIAEAQRAVQQLLA